MTRIHTYDDKRFREVEEIEAFGLTLRLVLALRDKEKAERNSDDEHYALSQHLKAQGLTFGRDYDRMDRIVIFKPNV